MSESDYTDLVKAMYHSGSESSDADLILAKINHIIDTELSNQNTELQINSKMTRDDIERARRNLKKNQKLRMITFDRFLNILLDFSLLQHEKFLHKFVDLFNSIDTDRDGILDEDQMIKLIERLNIVESEEHINTILAKVDPNNNKLITFSDTVQVFTDTEVVIEAEDNGVDKAFTVNVIEKLNNLE